MKPPIKSLADLKPANLRFAQGTAKFAVNRRELTMTGIINGKNPAGPVDHDVPVLEVTAPDGNLRAILFGYACHNTTLSRARFMSTCKTRIFSR